jgi:hypothetical protein
MSVYGGMLNEENVDYDYYELSRCLDPKAPPRPWGCLVHPDEIRKILHFGNGTFFSVNGDTFSDYQLKNWADLIIRSFADFLNHDIYPRLFRARSRWGFDPTKKLEEIEPYAELDDLYDFKLSQANYHFVKLRHRPLYKLHSWKLISPYNNQTLLDMTDRAVPHYNSGILRSTLLLPHSVYGMTGSNPLMGINQYRTQYGAYGMAVPGSYEIEYSTGYPSAERVPKELLEQIHKLVIISVGSSFGDGIMAGIANYSVSLSGVSESLGTTMSATSAMYGARIQQLQGELKDWITRNKIKYSGIQMGVL